MRYLGNPEYRHDGSDRVGLLLVNNGSPERPDVRSVRRYLRRFLGDPRLIELPRALWLPILNGIILLTRPPRTARKYRAIWTERGSPMQARSEDLRDALAERLRAEYGDRLRVAIGMSYGAPSVASGLDELRNGGCTRLIVLPLYPQYAGVTTGSVFDSVSRALQRWRWVPALRFVNGYESQPEYIRALAESLRDHWARRGRAEKLMLSFHSMPRKYADAGDPYPCFCERTVRLLAKELRLSEGDYSLTYQSRFGRGQWLQPYTEDVLRSWREDGVRSVDLICPGFAVDNLETLEEIEEDYAGQFARGGGELRLVPCLNAGPGQISALGAVVARHLAGWEAELRPARALPSQRTSAGRAGAA